MKKYCPLSHENYHAREAEEVEEFMKNENYQDVIESIRAMRPGDLKKIDEEDDLLPCYNSGLPNSYCVNCPKLIGLIHSLENLYSPKTSCAHQLSFNYTY